MRNRVHLKPDKQVKITEPSLKSEEQKPKDQSAPPTHQPEAPQKYVFEGAYNILLVSVIAFENSKHR